MAWADLLADARATLHTELGLVATYTPPGVGATAVPTTVRLVREMVNHGDLDRQGFAKVREDINSLIVDTAEVSTPARNGRFNVTGHGIFRVEDVEPADGQFLTVIVVRVPA